MFRRIIGVVMLVLGLIGLAISFVGVYYGRQLVDNMFGSIDDTLTLASETLDTAVDSLELTKATIGDVNAGLETVQEATLSVSKTMTDTQPLVNQIGVVVSQNAPQSIEAVQAAIPNIAAVAGTIDQTLITLNDFRIEEDILGVEINYDLGIDYQRSVPFDQSFIEMGAGLEGLPETLRSVGPSLATTNENLTAISLSIDDISADIGTINGRVAEVPALIDQYIDIVTQIQDSLLQLQTQVIQQQELVKNVITFVLIWWGLPQLALAMIGWDFLFGRRGATAAEIKEDVMEDLQDEIEEIKEEKAETQDKVQEESADIS
jgi:methyl-accepting chemotaxis protein